MKFLPWDQSFGRETFIALYWYLGAVEMNDACETCGQTSAMCPGHFGHINLPLPVYNPLLFTTLFQVS